MSEYVKLIAMNAIAVTLFFGGWQFPGLQTLANAVSASFGEPIGNAVFGLTSLGAFLLKVTVLSFLSVWIRATLPRVRYDQLMDLGWKVLLPMALVNVVITAVVNVLIPDSPWLSGIILLVLGVITIVGAAAIGKPKSAPSQVTLVKDGVQVR